MTLRRAITPAFLFALLLLPVGCCTAAPHGSDHAAEVDDDDEDEIDVALADVPEAVMSAAEAALPGARIVEAELETEDGITVYSLDALLDGEEWELEVTPEGRVLEVERDDEEDDDEDDDRA